MSLKTPAPALSIAELLCHNEEPAEPFVKEKKVSTYAAEEKERVRRRVDGFDWRQSRVWLELTAHFGPKLNQDELISIAQLVSCHAHVKLDRDAKRRKVVLVKWFEEHWGVIRPLIGSIVLDGY